MDASTYARAKAVLEAVLDLEEGALHDQVERLCAGDADLRAEVEDLLRYRSANILAHSLASGSEAPIDFSARLLGRHIGRYTLADKVGEGGMGVVFEAIQERPRRSVAIKLLRGQVLTQRAVRRFEFEVETLGQLTHPNIAQVFEAGVERVEGEDMPWFAMELVRGARPIDVYCAETRAGAREKLDLVLQVCDALDHGHSRGVVHRDVKPGNVLVDVDGRVKVIDFGIARATDADLSRTVSAFAIEGTLAYMSPEQCNGDRTAIGAASDVHALGVLTYELLCGRRPFDVDDKSLAAAARIICETEALAPSRFDRSLRGDLDAIVLKCLEKDPQRRYSSAGALATDLRRFMRGDSIEARAPIRWRRFARWIARHPWPTIGIATATLVVVASVATWVFEATIARRPDRVERSGQVARLMSRGGSELWAWDVGDPSAVITARLASSSAAREAEREFLLAIDSRSRETPWAGHVHIFDLDRPETARWSSSSWPLTMPEGKRLRPEANFSPTIVLQSDVFEDLPGEELVVVHREVPYSACAIRVYGWDGSLRYEAWNEGAMSAIVWLEKSRLIVFAAFDAELEWTKRGVAMPDSSANYPTLLVALQPVDGRTRVERFMVGLGTRRDETMMWCRSLGPPEAFVPLGATTLRLNTQIGHDGGEQIMWSLASNPDMGMFPPANFTVVLSPDGREISRFPDDSYRRWRDAGRVPPLSDYRVIDYEELPRPQ